MNTAKILWVDDEMESLKSQIMFLEHKGYDVKSLSNGHDAIATGCPFCRIMLTDGLTAKQADGSAPETTEVLDVAQLLLEAVKRDT